MQIPVVVSIIIIALVLIVNNSYLFMVIETLIKIWVSFFFFFRIIFHFFKYKPGKEKKLAKNTIEMSSFLKNLSDEIWDKDWWLPKGSNWSEIRKYTGIDLQQYISVCSAFAVFIYLVRIVFERFLAKPLGRHLNVPDKELFEHNPKLELYYKEKDQVLTDSVVRVSCLYC